MVADVLYMCDLKKKKKLSYKITTSQTTTSKTKQINKQKHKGVN